MLAAPELRHRASSLLAGLLLPGWLLVGALPSIAPAQFPEALQPRPLAVLGDSDSAGYQDHIGLPDPKARGGAERGRSLQWTEVLARLRAEAFDLGPREALGESGALSMGWTWLSGGTPRGHKFDHRHNFAVSGWGCESLLDSRRAQVPALLGLMQEDPQRWAQGVVVIRIGVNDFGQTQALEALAANPSDPTVTADIDRCLDRIGRSVRALQQAQPGLWVVLVGIFDNSHWPPLHERWQSPAALANIGRGLDRFDAGLRQLVSDAPQRLFFDERAWFARTFGGRDARGLPDYRRVRVGTLELSNRAGDSPEHAVLADGHAGTVWNALWADALIELLAAHLQPPEPRRLSPEEIAQLLR